MGPLPEHFHGSTLQRVDSERQTARVKRQRRGSVLAVAKERVSIPEELAAQVLYEADRTCCVCRVNRQVQIHHIDDDPSNNIRENLVVLCLLCHDETQVRGGFTRKLTAAVVRMYRDSWHGAVKLKLNPGLDGNKRILVAEALQDVIQRSHQWRDVFRYLMAPDDRSWEAADLWARTIELAPKTFDPDTYGRLSEMFDTGLKGVTLVLDRVQVHCGDVLPFDIRTLLLRTRRNLDAESRRHASFPANVGRQKEATDRYYAQLYESVLYALQDLANTCASRQRDVLGDISLAEDHPDHGNYDDSF